MPTIKIQFAGIPLDNGRYTQFYSEYNERKGTNRVHKRSTTLILLMIKQIKRERTTMDNIKCCVKLFEW